MPAYEVAIRLSPSGQGCPSVHQTGESTYPQTYFKLLQYAAHSSVELVSESLKLGYGF